MNQRLISELRGNEAFSSVYNIVEHLGKGGFGVVLKVEKKVKREIIALKVLRKKNDSESHLQFLN